MTQAMMQLAQAARIMNGVLLGADRPFYAVGTDSRTIADGQLFFALKGENFDGEQYALQALKQGAVAVVITDENNPARPAILVKSALLAMGELASDWVQQWRSPRNKPVIAITGSNGKTTTKEMLTAILIAATGNQDKVHATHGNLNNHIGLPLTLLKLQPTHEYAVIEMGMNHLLEIDYLTHITKPNIALINNAGTAHIGELGSAENIAQAKGEIFAGLASDGIAVINEDDRFADYWKSLNEKRKIITFGIKKSADVMATYVEKAESSEITLTTPTGRLSFMLKILGTHNISNALAAAASAVALNISNVHIEAGLSNFAGVSGRLQRKAGLNGAVLIDDTYNANPDSMKAAIDVLAGQAGNRILVLGAMGELGARSAQMHYEIGVYAKSLGLKKLYCLNEVAGENTSELSVQMVHGFGAGAVLLCTPEQIVAELEGQLGAVTTVLIKGSRFMKMERVVQLLAVSSAHTDRNKGDS